jgi:DNA polymerase III subunit epsilon
MGPLPGWLSRARTDAGNDARWIVIDTETTGLDPARDALLAIGGVAIDAHGVLPGDSFEILIRNTRHAERANIALHGIGREAQRAGTMPGDALAAFVAWADCAPCFAFHADFDRAFIERCARESGVRMPRREWIDVAPLAAALATDAPHRDRRTTLDEWLVVHGIACAARHNAASDAFATAELVLRLRAEAARQGAATLRALARLARQARWLGAS